MYFILELPFVACRTPKLTLEQLFSQSRGDSACSSQVVLGRFDHMTTLKELLKFVEVTCVHLIMRLNLHFIVSSSAVLT